MRMETKETFKCPYICIAIHSSKSKNDNYIVPDKLKLGNHINKKGEHVFAAINTDDIKCKEDVKKIVNAYIDEIFDDYKYYLENGKSKPINQ